MPKINWFYIWVPFVSLSYILTAWLSLKNNQHGGKWLWITYAAGLLYLWPLVSRYSKNLLFDGALYDLVYALSYGPAILILSSAKYNWWQATTGLILTIIGLRLIASAKI